MIFLQSYETSVESQYLYYCTYNFTETKIHLRKTNGVVNCERYLIYRSGIFTTYGIGRPNF